MKLRAICRLAILGFVALTIGVPVRALDYIESSYGLGVPEWESGRTEMEMADLNLDGNIDLITIGDHGSPFINTQEHGIAVYFGNGEGRWSVFQNGNFGYGGIAVGDVNGDDLPDVGYAMHHDYSSTDFGDQLIEVALGDGTGQNWTPWDDNLATQGEDYGMFATDLGDVDNDGDLDVAATSFGFGNPLMVYLNNGDGTWTFSQAVVDGNCGMHIVFGDINKDGNLDLATAYQNGTVYFGYGNGQFYNADYNLPPGSGSYNRHGVALGDVDNDGGMDLAWVSSSALHVWAFDEATTSWEDFTGSLPSTGISGYAQLWDMNSDGFCDVLTGGGNQVNVWTGDGAGGWTLASHFGIGTLQAFRVGGDMDHNGFADITHEGDGQPHCFIETSVASALSIMPYFPHGGEVFKGGSERFIDWISAVPIGATSNVSVELSLTGMAGPWTILGQDLPNHGRLQWTVPTGQTSTNCYLRFIVSSGVSSDTAWTPGAFTILGTAPDVQVTLEPVNPPIIIAPTGGSFDYVISLINNETVPIGCSVWIDVTLPGGSIYGPVINAPLSAPVGTQSRTRTQFVPANAPAGDYSYNAHVGIYPGTVWSSDSFTFTKTGAGAWGLGASDWLSIGESFDGDDQVITPNSSLITSSFPNPFNASTAISFQLPADSHVQLMVYDLAGRPAAELVNGPRAAGVHRVAFDASQLPSGIYFYRLTAGEFVGVKKLILLK
jgi:hypothetical protein